MSEALESISSFSPGHSKNINRSIAMNGSTNKVSGAASPVAVTLPAVAGKGNIIGQITCGYTAAPTGGSLTIEDESGTTVFGPMPITIGGPIQFTFSPALRGRTNKATVITLSSGGGALVGTLAVTAWLEN